MDDFYDSLFWEKVDKKDDSECWEWTAFRNSDGYGMMGIGNRKCMLSHRYSYSYHYGTIPDGLLVLHKCDNPPCVNPLHLFIGTDADNARDKMNKGRAQGYKGETNPSSKYSEAIIRTIRNEFDNDKAPGKVERIYANHPEIPPSTLRKIIYRLVWKHVI